MKVTSARQYKVSNWLIEALIKREEAISDAEAEQLGLLAVRRSCPHSRGEKPQTAHRAYQRWESGPFDRADYHCEDDIRREFLGIEGYGRGGGMSNVTW